MSSDDLDGLRLLRDRAPAGWISPPANTATPDVFPPHARRRRGRRPAGGRHPLGGFTGFRAPPCSVRAPPAAVSAYRAGAACARRLRRPSARHLEYFHDHVRIEQMLFDGAPTTVEGALCPDLRRPGLGARARRKPRPRPSPSETRWILHRSGEAPCCCVPSRAASPTRQHRSGARSPPAGRRRGRFEAGYRAIYATDASTIRQPLIGVVVPGDAEALVGGGGLPPTWRADSTWRRHRPGRRDVQHRRRNRRRAKYINLILAIHSAPGRRGCSLGRLRRCRDARRAVRPDLRVRASTHDRGTIGGMTARTPAASTAPAHHGSGRIADNVAELEILTYGGLGVRVGESPSTEDGPHPRGGPAGRALREALRACATNRRSDPRALPDIPRRVSG